LRNLVEQNNFKMIILSNETILKCLKCHFERTHYNSSIKETNELRYISEHSKWHKENPNRDYKDYEEEQLAELNRKINERLAPLFRKLRF